MGGVGAASADGKSTSSKTRAYGRDSPFPGDNGRYGPEDDPEELRREFFEKFGPEIPTQRDGVWTSKYGGDLCCEVVEDKQTFKKESIKIPAGFIGDEDRGGSRVEETAGARSKQLDRSKQLQLEKTMAKNSRKNVFDGDVINMRPGSSGAHSNASSVATNSTLTPNSFDSRSIETSSNTSTTGVVAASSSPPPLPLAVRDPPSSLAEIFRARRRRGGSICRCGDIRADHYHIESEVDIRAKYGPVKTLLTDFCKTIHDPRSCFFMPNSAVLANSIMQGLCLEKGESIGLSSPGVSSPVMSGSSSVSAGGGSPVTTPLGNAGGTVTREHGERGERESEEADHSGTNGGGDFSLQEVDFFGDGSGQRLLKERFPRIAVNRLGDISLLPPGCLPTSTTSGDQALFGKS